MCSKFCKCVCGGVWGVASGQCVGKEWAFLGGGRIRPGGGIEGGKEGPTLKLGKPTRASWMYAS